jgi:hypothetical protein
MPQRDLAAELRSARTPAPAELRERVRLIAAAGPSRRPRLPRVTWRRALAVAVPVAAAVAAATVALTRPCGHPAGAQHAEAFRAATAAPSTKLAPAATTLTLREPDAAAVARAARRAQAIVVSLSGYATSVDVHGTHGRLVLHVPAARAPQALARLRALGDVAGQRGAAGATIELRLAARSRLSRPTAARTPGRSARPPAAPRTPG